MMCLPGTPQAEARFGTRMHDDLGYAEGLPGDSAQAFYAERWLTDPAQALYADGRLADAAQALHAESLVLSDEELVNGTTMGQVEQLRSLTEQQQSQIIGLQEQLLYQQKLIATMRAGGQRTTQRAEQLQNDLEKATAALQIFEERYSKVLKERDEAATIALQSIEERYSRVERERHVMLHERDRQIAALNRELERREVALQKKDKTITSLLEQLANARGIPPSVLQEAVDLKFLN